MRVKHDWYSVNLDNSMDHLTDYIVNIGHIMKSRYNNMRWLYLATC